MNDYRTQPVPKEGHPYHVPVAVPTGGDYNHWMVIRGIHTNRSLWDTSVPGHHTIRPGTTTMYGFWLNDPASGGIGNNLYVTSQYFKDNYFDRLNVPGDYYTNKFVVITDPPQDINVDTSAVDINYAPTATPLTMKEGIQLQRAFNGFNGIGRLSATIKIVENAFNQANTVLSLDTVFGADFAGSHAMYKPVMNADGSFTVTFVGSQYRFDVGVSSQGGLLQIQISTLNS